MARISQNKIDEINQAADIVDVVSEFVSLQPAGKSMKGLCPFHSEKTPSFFVDKDKQIFNCFGCHKKGGSIKFIQEYKHIGFVDALKYLADKYHIELEYNNNEVTKSYDKLYKINKTAKDFYNLNLLNLDSGKTALDYLLNRNIDKHTLNEFDIGYAPAKNNQLMKNLLENFQEYELVEAGLINRSDDGDYYDVFRDRIMFPIHDEYGKVLGFSGRILTDKKDSAKYVNSKTTKIFNKGEILYNLDKALPFINQKKRVVLMEGFFDVIQASLAGIKESVCTMGTELTYDQAKKIKKYANQVVICYDGDKPGKEATYKALSILENVNLEVQIALLPDELDPDEYIKKNSQALFRNHINQNLMDKYDFVYEMIIEKGLSTSSDIEKAKVSLFKFLASSASKTITTIYLQKFSEKINLDIDVINQDFNKFLFNQRKFTNIKETKREVIKPTVTKNVIKAEEKIINYYLKSEDYREIIDDEFFNFRFTKGYRYQIFATLRELHQNNREVALYNLKTDLSENIHDELDKILLKDNYNYSENELKELIDTLILDRLRQDIEAMRIELTQLIAKDNLDDFRSKDIELRNKRKLYEEIRRRRNDKKRNF
ncbi:MAG: DNA primase [Candidatus Izimaplasma sp.]|nr:DNA primase [Candidatus Izimaplasma bacterium]